MIQLNIFKLFQEFIEIFELLIIEQLLDIGVVLFDIYNLGELLNLILFKSWEIICSDVGSVYLVDEVNFKECKLVFKVV